MTNDERMTKPAARNPQCFWLGDAICGSPLRLWKSEIRNQLETVEHSNTGNHRLTPDSFGLRVADFPRTSDFGFHSSFVIRHLSFKLRCSG